MNSFDVIIKPLLTEKTYKGIQDKTYAFLVHIDATKTQIKKAVEEVFGVKVAKVNTMNYDGKFKVQGKTSGYTSKRKKAIVYLTDNSPRIAFFEGLN